jgi:hypothetical protein
LFIAPRDLFVFDLRGGLLVAAEFGSRAEPRVSSQVEGHGAH